MKTIFALAFALVLCLLPATNIAAANTETVSQSQDSYCSVEQSNDDSDVAIVDLSQLDIPMSDGTKPPTAEMQAEIDGYMAELEVIVRDICNDPEFQANSPSYVGIATDRDVYFLEESDFEYGFNLFFDKPVFGYVDVESELSTYLQSIDQGENGYLVFTRAPYATELANLVAPGCVYAEFD